jgi:hypothetical protein
MREYHRSRLSPPVDTSLFSTEPSMRDIVPVIGSSVGTKGDVSDGKQGTRQCPV